MSRAVLILALAWLAPAPAPTLWSAPEACPDEAALRERVELLAPGLLARAGDPRAEIAVEVTRRASDYEAEILLGPDRERSQSLVSESCETVADAAALVIAVHLDAVETAEHLAELRAAAGRPPPSRPTVPTLHPTNNPSPPPTPERVAPEDPSLGSLVVAAPNQGATRASSRVNEGRDDPGRPARLRVGLRAFGGPSYGPTDAAYAALGGMLGLAGLRWRVALGGLATPARRVTTDAGIGARFSSWAVLAHGCFMPDVGQHERIQLPLCGGIELGQLRGRGVEGLAEARAGASPWIAPSLSQGLWFAPHPRFALGVDASLAIPVLPARFVVDGQEIDQSVPASFRGLIGVELRLP